MGFIWGLLYAGRSISKNTTKLAEEEIVGIIRVFLKSSKSHNKSEIQVRNNNGYINIHLKINLGCYRKPRVENCKVQDVREKRKVYGSWSDYG